MAAVADLFTIFFFLSFCSCVSILRHRLAMSMNGSPHAVANGAFQRFPGLTPTRDLDDDAPETTSKTECKLLIYQLWGGPNKELVEQKRRKRVQMPQYWRREIECKLNIVAERTSSAELPKLHQTIDGLDKILLRLGESRENVEDARFRIPGADTAYWDDDLDFQRGLKEEKQGSNQSNGEVSQPAQPTRTPPLPEPPHVLAPRSNNSCSPPTKGVQGARVQKKRPKNNWTQNRRSTRSSTQKQKSTVREEEPASTASPKPSSGKRTVRSAPISHRRAGNKQTADNLCGSAGVQKSTRTRPGKPLITREYHLRSRGDAAT